MNSDQVRIVLAWLLIIGGFALFYASGNAYSLVFVGVGILVRSTCLKSLDNSPKSEELSTRWRVALVGVVVLMHFGPAVVSDRFTTWLAQVKPALGWIVGIFCVALAFADERRAFLRAGKRTARNDLPASAP